MSDEVRVFTGRITAGKLHVRSWKALELRDGEVSITVERLHATRSLAQNAFWWAVVIPAFSAHCGYDPLEMHEVLKVALLGRPREIVDTETGDVKEVIVGGSTRRLNKLEFIELIERAQRLGATMGIDIPNPNEAAA